MTADGVDDETVLSAETTRLSIADDTVGDATRLSVEPTHLRAGDDTVIIEESTVMVGAISGTKELVDDLADVRLVARISNAPNPETCARLRLSLIHI